MKNQIIQALIIQYSSGGIYLFGVVIWNESVMLSAITGCIACLVPNTYQSIRMLRQANNNNAGEWLAYAYQSEFVKWLMTGMIFVLAFTANYEWDPIILFAGFVLMQMSSWFIPFIFKGN